MVKKPITYVILGVLLITCGLLLQKFAGAYYTSQAYFDQLVEKNLEEELTDLEYDMIPILDSVSVVEIIKFGDFKLPTKYPYFIYRNKYYIAVFSTVTQNFFAFFPFPRVQ